MRHHRFFLAAVLSAAAHIALAQDRPAAFLMKVGLGQGISYTPASVHAPLSERLALTASVTLGGPQRRTKRRVPLADAELRRLRYRTLGQLAVGVHAYRLPRRLGAFGGAGASIGASRVTATSYRDPNVDEVVWLFAPHLGALAELTAYTRTSTRGVRVGGFLVAGFAWETARRAKRQELFARADFTPLRRAGYVVADGRLGEVTRSLGADFPGAQASVLFGFAFGL